MLSKTDLQNIITELNQKYWSDPLFKASILKEPRSILSSYGIIVKDNIKIVLYEINSLSEIRTQKIGVFEFPFLKLNTTMDLSDDDLQNVAGGSMKISDLKIVYLSKACSITDTYSH